jgi:toxin FitB
VSYLVDTNILSEPTQKFPETTVLAWLEAHAGQYYVSSVTLGEIIFGIERLPRGPKRRNLEVWLQATLARLQGRVLTFNNRVAAEWGRLMAEAEARGHIMPVVDSQLAATARRHGLTVVTDNVDDFKHCGVRLLNPFD